MGLFGLTKAKNVQEAHEKYRALLREQRQAHNKALAESDQKHEERLGEVQEQIDAIKDISGVYKRRLGSAEDRIEKLKEADYIFSRDSDESGYTEVGTSRWDMIKTDYREIQKQCVEIFKINPYAKRIVEMKADFVIGDGITWTVAGEEKDKGTISEIEIALEAFWNDYDNDFDKNLPSMSMELDTLGEQIYPIIDSEHTRIVKLGHVDPRLVDSILKNPVNRKRSWQIFTDTNRFDPKERFFVFGVINELPDGKLGVHADQKIVSEKDIAQFHSRPDVQYVADAFLFQINRLPSQERGYSELMTMLDTLDLLDQFIFQVAERSLMLYHFLMDVTLKGAGKEEVNKWRQQNPRTSSVMAHNEKCTIQYITPDLKSIDAKNLVQTVTRFALAGAGIPEHWIVAGDNTNFATAKEQNTPIEKRLERSQGKLNQMLRELTRYQLEKWFPNDSPNQIKEKMEMITFNFPSVAGVDRKLNSEVMLTTSQALTVMERNGWITKKAASDSVVQLGNKLGLPLEAPEIDETEEPDEGVGTQDKVDSMNSDIADEIDEMRSQFGLPSKPEKVEV